jgi:hypothetical protein
VYNACIRFIAATLISRFYVRRQTDNTTLFALEIQSSSQFATRCSRVKFLVSSACSFLPCTSVSGFFIIYNRRRVNVITCFAFCSTNIIHTYIKTHLVLRYICHLSTLISVTIILRDWWQ